MSTTLRVGFDLDGVLYPFVPALRHYLAEHHRYPLVSMPDPTLWDFGPEWGLTPEEFVAAMHASVDDGVMFRHGDPTPGAAEVIDSLRAAGHTVHIITSRFIGSDPATAAAATRWWLDEHGIAYDTLTISSDKTVVPTDYYLDDLPANVEAVKAAGSSGVLMDAGYNRESRQVRVHSLEQYAAMVEMYAYARDWAGVAA